MATRFNEGPRNAPLDASIAAQDAANTAAEDFMLSGVTLSEQNQYDVQAPLRVVVRSNVPHEKFIGPYMHTYPIRNTALSVANPSYSILQSVPFYRNHPNV